MLPEMKTLLKDFWEWKIILWTVEVIECRSLQRTAEQFHLKKSEIHVAKCFLPYYLKVFSNNAYTFLLRAQMLALCTQMFLLHIKIFIFSQCSTSFSQINSDKKTFSYFLYYHNTLANFLIRSLLSAHFLKISQFFANFMILIQLLAHILILS